MKIDQMSIVELEAKIAKVKSSKPYGVHQKTLVALMQHQIEKLSKDMIVLSGKFTDRSDKEVKKVDKWNALPLEKKREIEHSKICYFCGGEIRTIACGPDGWETFCVSCDFLYDED